MRSAALILLVFALVGCDESMDQQNRLKTYGEAPEFSSWPGAGEMILPVVGTVAQGDLAFAAALHEPPAVTLALIERGRERYEIYCAACHGLTGAGDGMVVARGFPRPASFDDPRVMRSSARHLVDVIGDGYGIMYSLGDRIEPTDRWAITAYIRALQLADARPDTPP